MRYMARPGPPYAFRATEVSRFIFSPAALQIQDAVLASELRLAIDAFARSARGGIKRRQSFAPGHECEVNSHSMAKMTIVPAKT